MLASRQPYTCLYPSSGIREKCAFCTETQVLLDSSGQTVMVQLPFGPHPSATPQREPTTAVQQKNVVVVVISYVAYEQAVLIPASRVADVFFKPP